LQWPSANSYHWQAMTAELTARPLTSADTAFAVRTVAAVQPHHPWAAEELHVWWRTADRMGRRRTLVVEEAGRPAGWIDVSLFEKAAERDGRLMVFLPGAAPEQLDHAWAIAEEAGRELGVRLGRASVWEDDVLGLGMLERRGWERKRVERFWRLELVGQVERLRELRVAARRRVEAAGLRIATAADLGGEAVYPELHRVDEAASEDIPRDVPRVPIPYEVWLQWVSPPGVLPERMWVGLSGDRPVGTSFLDYGSTPVSTGFTGVLREHRGAGLARALKLETVVQAAELGVEAVETDNDYANAPILHLNEELGYRGIPGQVKLHKRL
jgi:hypothetical protein